MCEWSARPDVTSQLIPVLLSDSGVLNLTVVAGSVRNPDGDAVQFDVLQGSANQVLARLRQFGLDQRGSIAVEPVSTSISAAADPGSGGPLALR